MLRVYSVILVAVSRLRKTVAKVLKNGRESLWDTSLNEPFPRPRENDSLLPRLIRILVTDWAHKMFLCPVGDQHLSRCFRDLLIRGILLAISTVRRRCLARAGELSSRRVFSENELHKPEEISLACYN